jgi:hypothetical protein
LIGVPPRLSIVAAGLLVLVVTITAACQADRAADMTPVSGVTEVIAKRLQFQPPARNEVNWRFEDDPIPQQRDG